VERGVHAQLGKAEMLEEAGDLRFHGGESVTAAP